MSNLFPLKSLLEKKNCCCKSWKLNPLFKKPKIKSWCFIFKIRYLKLKVEASSHSCSTLLKTSQMATLRLPEHEFSSVQWVVPFLWPHNNYTDKETLCEINLNWSQNRRIHNAYSRPSETYQFDDSKKSHFENNFYFLRFQKTVEIKLVKCDIPKTVYSENNNQYLI